jgi:tripartite ATP-independent transporter DctM subunit
MEWWLVLIIIFGVLVAMMTTGLPIAFSFLMINMVGLYLYFGAAGLQQLIYSMYTSLDSFILLPIPLFMLMGDVMFYSGIAPVLIHTLDKLLGKLPGRLSLLAVGAGTLIATLTGVSMASVAMLGSTLLPDMEKFGYKKTMSLGPIMGCGGLAMMIPPSSMAVLAGAIGQVSVGKILIAIIFPGLMMASLYALYIILRCRLQPVLAPSYEVRAVPFSEKVVDLGKYVLPQGIIIFLVIGVIFLGIATPSEAAATGCFGTIFLAAIYKKLNLKIMVQSLKSTVGVTGMIFFIIAGSTAYSQIIAYSGAGAGLTQLTTTLPLAPIVVIILMQLVVLVLGMFMSIVAIMMITLPIFIPVVISMNFDPVWFMVIFLVNVETALISPPFGMSLFVMKGVAAKDTTMGDVFRAAVPFFILNVIAMALMLLAPPISTWLPGLMG